MKQRQNIDIKAGTSVQTGDIVQEYRVHLEIPERRIEEYFSSLRSNLKSTAETRRASDQEVQLLNERIAELESLLRDKAGVKKTNLQAIASGIRENCDWAWPIISSVLKKMLPAAAGWV